MRFFPANVTHRSREIDYRHNRDELTMQEEFDEVLTLINRVRMGFLDRLKQV